MKILRSICKIAKEAGNVIMKFYYNKKLIKIDYKSNNTPVTNVDREANNIIKNMLFFNSKNIDYIRRRYI